MSTGDHSSIKHWPEDERPRKRLIKYGEDKLSDANLLGILIGSGDRQTRKNAVDLSRDLLTAFGSLRYLDRLRQVDPETGEWRISERRHTLDWATEVTSNFAATLAQRMKQWP